MPISSRNTSPAIINLLLKTSCHHLILTEGSAIVQAAHGIQSTLRNQAHELELVPFPSLDAFLPQLGCTFDKNDLFVRYPPIIHHGHDLPAMYLHSSGSTGFPKPIPLTQRYIFELMKLRTCFLWQTMDFGYSVNPFHLLSCNPGLWELSAPRGDGFSSLPPYGDFNSHSLSRRYWWKSCPLDSYYPSSPSDP